MVSPRMSHERRLAYHRARFGKEMSRNAAAKVASVSTSWGYYEDMRVGAGVQERLDLVVTRNQSPSKRMDVAQAVVDVPPIPFQELTSEATRGLEDFHFFAERHFGIVTTPWRRTAFRELWRLWDSPEREYLVMNAPPGSGKSQFIMHDFAAWLTVRDRKLRGLQGSATHRLASRYTKRLRNTFSRRRPLVPSDSDLALDLAQPAMSTLVYDYGRFRAPEQSQMWQADQFDVEQYGNLGTGQKEPTWQAYGRDSDQLGNRVDVVVWDDLVTRKSLRDTISEEFVVWFTDEAETRIDPGGLFVLQGQRLDANDLYRNRLDITSITFDDNGDEVLERMYWHISFPAHFDDDCNGEHSLDAPIAEFDAEGEHIPTSGCLLDPKRLSWRFLRGKQAANQRNFDVVYQQRNVALGSKLVSNAWIHGGTEDGIEYVGCVDKERGILEFPPGLAPNTLSVASVDPSGTNSWALEWWLNEPDCDVDHLIDLHKGPMRAEDLLSFNPATGEYYGAMNTWQLRSVQMRRPIMAWIVEVNAAQRYLLQHAFVRQWMQMNQVVIIPHQTHRWNKADPDLGFWAMRNQFKWGKCRLPYKTGTEAFNKSRKIIDEAMRYPSNYSDDALMAYWMYRLNLPRLVPEVVDYRPVSRPAPSWARA